MRILIHGINFPPEITGIGKYTGELAAYLCRSGHEVHIVTAPPYYPYWQVQAGYKAWQYGREIWQGAEVYRCPLWVPRAPTGLKRLLHLLSFALSSLPVLLGQCRWAPDVILCIAPAFFCAPFAWFAARLSGAKSWLHVQDFELDAALGLVMLPGGKVVSLIARAFEYNVLTRFDRVSTISESMLALALKKGVAERHTRLLPNWVDSRQIHPLEGRNPLRGELNIPRQKKVVLYHGNMGRKQGLEILLETARMLCAQRNILFLLSGEGPARAELGRQAIGLPNVRIVDLQSQERLNELVDLADVHVLPQRVGAADLVMPSKLSTMLASGKPVIASAAPGTQLWKVVQQVGITVLPECAEALAAAIVVLIEDPAECARLGRLGRAYARQHLEKEIVLGKFMADLQALVPQTGEADG